MVIECSFKVNNILEILAQQQHLFIVIFSETFFQLDVSMYTVKSNGPSTEPCDSILNLEVTFPNVFAK